MEIYYINHLKAESRRDNIERILIKNQLQNRIHRFEALTADGFKGSITDAEIGCFRSHAKLINDIDNQHRIIFEDDVFFDEKGQLNIFTD